MVVAETNRLCLGFHCCDALGSMCDMHSSRSKWWRFMACVYYSVFPLKLNSKGLHLELFDTSLTH